MGGQHFSGGFGGPDWLAAKLRDVTGIDGVVPELKKQAEATYHAGRGNRILDFAAGAPTGWLVLPNVHLAYRFASVRQRIYLTCDLDLNEYVRRWAGEDFAYVGGHHCDQVHPVLWPWLLERGYAPRKDESQLPGFLNRLGKRDAHLRPGIRIQRTWSRAETASLDQRGALVTELRAAITESLAVLDEPLPPACARPRPDDASAGPAGSTQPNRYFVKRGTATYGDL